MKYTLKNARPVQAEFYSAIRSMGSPSLHLQQLTFVTSSPGQLKNSGLPLLAYQGTAALPLPLLQFSVQTLAPQRGWHGVTVAPRSQAVLFPFCPLQTLLELQGKWRTQNTVPNRTDLEHVPCGAPGETLAKGEHSKRVSKELRYIL